MEAKTEQPSNVLRYAAVVLALAACGDDASNSAPGSELDASAPESDGGMSDAAAPDSGMVDVEMTVGPEGGELSAEGVELTIPEGALDEEVQIRIRVVPEPVELPEAWEASGEFYEITPHGLSFAVPITIELPYDGIDDESLHLVKLEDADDESWAETEAESFDDGRVRFSTSSLSFYAVVRICPLTLDSLEPGAVITGCEGRECGPHPQFAVCGSCGSCGAGEMCGGDGLCQIGDADAGADAATSSGQGDRDAATGAEDAGGDGVTRIFVAGDASGNNDGTSWADAYTDLQTAIDSALPKSVVMVKRGVYLPSSWPNGGSEPRERHFSLKNGVAVVGGFDGTESSEAASDPEANDTVLSGDFAGDDVISGSGASLAISGNADNAYSVFYHPESAQLDASAVLRGVTVTGGNAEQGNSFNQATGGGMYNDGSHPTVEACTFTGNRAYYQGGAILFGTGNLESVVRDSVFSNNLADQPNSGWGAAIASMSSLLVVDSRFVGNRASREGGAAYLVAPARIDGCLFDGNHAGAGGAMSVKSNSWINRSVFVGNYAVNVGGAVHNYSEFGIATPIYANSLFVGNESGGDGGAIYNGGGSNGAYTWLINCTVAGNHAGSRGGAMISFVASTQKVVNSVLAGNTAATSDPEYLCTQATSVALSTSLLGLSQLPAGTTDDGGNIVDPDPGFASPSDPAGGDGVLGTSDDGYALDSTSPGVESGSNAAYDEVTWGFDLNRDGVEEDELSSMTDITGASRQSGSAVDMGAFEVTQ